MLEPEERRKSIIEGLKKSIEKLPEKIDLIKYYIKKVNIIPLDTAYEREDRQTLDLFTRVFVQFYNTITKDFYIVISILSELNVHWMNQEGFYAEDMVELGLIDDLNTFEKIKKLKRTIEGDFVIYDQTKLWEDTVTYCEELFKMADKAAQYAKEKFIDQ